MYTRERLVWAEINLSHFAHNIRSIKQLIGKRTKLMAAVKANAYGHGIVGIAQACESLPVDFLGVVCLYELRQLRDAGVKLPVLILNYIDPEGAKGALELGSSINVWDEEVLQTVDAYAKKKNIVARIHVKVDTGMHRAGLLPDDALKFIPQVKKYTHVFLEGISTHFASSDEKDVSFTLEQLRVFQEVLHQLSVLGIKPPLIHAANSGGTIRLPTSFMTMVRPGIITYGLSPTGSHLKDEFSFPFIPKPVMRLKTMIVQIKTIQKGESVGYGRTFRANRKTQVALIPVGYGDGFRRAPNNWGHVLVQGKHAPILGRISMDQTTIDVTDIPKAQVGSEVILIGKQGKEEITADDVAIRLGTINYEVTTALSARVSREFIR